MITLMVESALRSMVLAMLTWLAVALLRIRNPQIAKAVWTTVLFGSLAMPALMQWSSLTPIPIARVSLPDIAVGAEAGHAPSNWPAVLVCIYVAVAGVLLLRFAIAFARVWLIRRSAVRLREEWVVGADVRVAANLCSPATFGSTILLPPAYSRWSEPRRRAVLAHERGHVRGRDCHVQWLAALHACVFWFSPLPWWLRQHLSKLAELASDDAALREMGRAARVDYAQILLETVQPRPTVNLAISIASGNVAQRIDRVLSDRVSTEVLRLRRRVLGVVLLVPAIVLAAAVTPERSSTTPTHQHLTPPRSQHASAGAAPGEVTRGRARIVSSGPLQELSRWYPKDAKQKGIEGIVTMAVTLDAASHPTDARVISESPPGAGFGAAASRVVHEMVYANPTGRRTVLRFKVQFKLSQKQYGTTNFETGGP